MNTKSLALITLSFAMLSCINSTAQSASTPTSKEQTTPQNSENWKLKETEAIATLYDWNEKHNTHTANHENLYYSDYVDFYGERKDATEITDIKAKMFKRYPDFHQDIIPSSVVTYKDEIGSIYRIEFTKRVTMNGKVKDYRSFLEFSSAMGTFFLSAEGDIEG